MTLFLQIDLSLTVLPLMQETGPLEIWGARSPTGPMDRRRSMTLACLLVGLLSCSSACSLADLFDCWLACLLARLLGYLPVVVVVVEVVIIEVIAVVGSSRTARFGMGLMTFRRDRWGWCRFLVCFLAPLLVCLFACLSVCLFACLLACARVLVVVVAAVVVVEEEEEVVVVVVVVEAEVAAE